MDKFRFGTVTVPDGERGLWKISTFTLTDDDVWLANMRALRDGTPEWVCNPGTYKRLTHKKRGCIMSNTRMEIITAREAYDEATGRVLINGLGLGMVLEGVLAKPDVTFVRVIEFDEDVIALVGPHFANDPRVEIVHADAYEYKPGKDERFDYVWHDIWDDVSPDNLPLMAKLCRKYGRKATKQGVWSRKQARREQRRYANRRGW